MPAFAAIDPGPLENRKEYGSKPASRAKTTETFPPIGSVPLIPMNELVNALGARLQSGDLFCFWIKYEAPTADRGSHGAPWLCQPPSSTCTIVGWYKVGRQARQSRRHMQRCQKIPIRVAAAPQSSQEANGFRAATIA